MRVGVAGVGNLGSAIAERLLQQGVLVSVWNRTASRAQPLREKGASIATTAEELAARSDVVFSLLTDEAALDAVYFGPAGLMRGGAGKTFIEMSTVRPQVQIKLAAKVREARGVHLECPVLGSRPAALSGGLIGLVGGEGADLERLRPLLSKLCKHIEHAGPVGDAASLKLALNLPVIVYFEALSEALCLVDHLGLEPHRLMHLFAESPGGPNVLKVRGKNIADGLAGADVGETHATVGIFAKDLRTMLAEAQANGARLPMVEATLREYERVQAEQKGEVNSFLLPALLLARLRSGKP